MTTADDFARRRLEHHVRRQRRYVVVAAVLVLVGAVVVGLLVAYAFGGDPEPERDADGRLVPPPDLVLDADAARDLVADGTWPGEARIEDMPSGDAERIGWLLSEVSWGPRLSGSLGDGLVAATGSDPDLAVALTTGVAGASRPVDVRLEVPVIRALATWQEPVATVLAGDEPGPDEPDFAEADLVATFSVVGLDAAVPLERPLVARMSRGWERALPAAGRDDPGAARRFTEEYQEVFRRWVRPVVVLYAAMAGEDCRDDQACVQLVTVKTLRADADLDALVLDSIPRELLPPAVGDALRGDTARHRRLPVDVLPAWREFREQQGYGVTGPVLDALAG